MLNSPKKPPAISSSVAQKAIDLLAAFGGGDKDIRNALSEMVEVQNHNEQLLTDAMKAKAEHDKQLVEISRGNDELTQRQSKFLKEVDAKEKSIVESMEKLRIASEGVSSRSKQLQAAYSAREDAIKKSESKLKSASDVLNVEQAKIIELQTRVDDAVQLNATRTNRLKDIFGYLERNLRD